MKECRRCNKQKPIGDFHTHKKMADGHLNICKLCVRKRVNQYRIIRNQDDDFCKKERERGREKYHRLNYRVKPSPRCKQARQAYEKRYPEKIKAVRFVRDKMGSAGHGFSFHHWSYNEAYWLDVITLPNQQHYAIHRHMKYDKEKLVYVTESNELLDTREKHEAFINTIPF